MVEGVVWCVGIDSVNYGVLASVLTTPTDKDKISQCVWMGPHLVCSVGDLGCVCPRASQSRQQDDTLLITKQSAMKQNMIMILCRQSHDHLLCHKHDNHMTAI